MVINDNDGYVQYRFERAKEAFDEAALLAQDKHLTIYRRNGINFDTRSW